MTEDEAVALMVDGGFQEEAEARAKYDRARLSSTQLSTYFVGLARDVGHRARGPAARGRRLGRPARRGRGAGAAGRRRLRRDARVRLPRAPRGGHRPRLAADRACSGGSSWADERDQEAAPPRRGPRRSRPGGPPGIGGGRDRPGRRLRRGAAQEGEQRVDPVIGRLRRRPDLAEPPPAQPPRPAASAELARERPAATRRHLPNHSTPSHLHADEGPRIGVREPRSARAAAGPAAADGRARGRARPGPPAGSASRRSPSRAAAGPTAGGRSNAARSRPPSRTRRPRREVDVDVDDRQGRAPPPRPGARRSRPNPGRGRTPAAARTASPPAPQLVGSRGRSSKRAPPDDARGAAEPGVRQELGQRLLERRDAAPAELRRPARPTAASADSRHLAELAEDEAAVRVELDEQAALADLADRAEQLEPGPRVAERDEPPVVAAVSAERLAERRADEVFDPSSPFSRTAPSRGSSRRVVANRLW